MVALCQKPNCFKFDHLTILVSVCWGTYVKASDQEFHFKVLGGMSNKFGDCFAEVHMKFCLEVNGIILLCQIVKCNNLKSLTNFLWFSSRMKRETDWIYVGQSFCFCCTEALYVSQRYIGVYSVNIKRVE